MVLQPINSISVMLSQWKDNDGLKLVLPPVGFDPEWLAKKARA